MCHLILLLPLFALPLFWVLPLHTAVPLYLSVLGISLFLYFKVFKAMMIPVRTGLEGMLGKIAVVIEDIDPEGKIEYAGEIWDAESKDGPLLRSEHVRVTGIRGLKVDVEAMTVPESSKHT